MDNNKIHDIITNISDKPNKDLLDSIDVLSLEFEKTKELVIELTRHMDSVEEMYNLILEELRKRNIVK